MSIWRLMKNCFRVLIHGRGYGPEELARRLDMPLEELHGIEPAYREFTIPKRAGGVRRILVPSDKLKALQRRLLRRLFGKLRCHPAAMGFERSAGDQVVASLLYS
jgi:hypothetical protein